MSSPVVTDFPSVAAPPTSLTPTESQSGDTLAPEWLNTRNLLIASGVAFAFLLVFHRFLYPTGGE